jgi:DNA-binding transcriptional ArsR family regulator
MRLQEAILWLFSGYRKQPITPPAPAPAIVVGKLPSEPRRVRIFHPLNDGYVTPPPARDLFSATATQPPAPSTASAPTTTTYSTEPAVKRTRKSTRGWRKLTNSQRLAILRKYASGERIGEIATALGVSDTTVSEVAIAHGLRRRNRRNTSKRAA